MGSGQRADRIARRLVLLVAVCAACVQAGDGVRAAAVAGEFYPAEPEALARSVDGLLAQTRTPPDGGLTALIVPHAGYAYSGHVAAEAYSLLKGRKFRRVVVIAPSHVVPFDFTSVYGGRAYRTPLGEVLVDQKFAAKLVKADPTIRLSPTGHEQTGARGEHSLEVQLPFLQRVLGDFAVVPVVMGRQDWDQCRRLGIALARLAREPGTLIVASSDLSHYHAYANAVALDRRVLRAVEAWDYVALSKNFDANVWEACGGGPIVAAMIAAERLGAGQARLLKYANSGDVTADRNRVVGYAAFALGKGTGEKKAPQGISREGQVELLSIARRSAETAVREGKLVKLETPPGTELLRDRGVFVTLKQRGVMRGCVGNTSASQPLHAAVRDVAALAAVRDPRFKPVTPDELDSLTYEVSILSPFRRVANPDQIVVGHHGLLIRQGEREGLLLPQIASQEGWNREMLLENVCRKAGLPPQAWREADADLFLFTAEVFSDP